MKVFALFPDRNNAEEAASVQRRGEQFLLWVVIVILICMALAALAAWTRAPWDDEGEFSNASWNLARHGYLGTQSWM